MDQDKHKKYEEAKKQVEAIKGWYSHLVVYIVVTIVYILFNEGYFDNGRVSNFIPWWSSITMPLGWGIGILCHYLYVFKGDFFLGRFKRWEADKINEYLEKQKEESKHF